VGLSASLRRLGFTLGRLKTGTPPRIDARTIDFAQTVHHPGSDEPLYFGFYYGDDESLGPPSPSLAPPNPIYPNLHPTAWRPQVPCYQVYTNAATHAIIRANLHRAPLYTGMIQGVGPRYCPSIEDKIVRFADKETHSLFLEPEGWETNEVYVQGANTSLPEDVQLAMLRTIPALRQVEMVRVGYAIEYDYVPSSQTLVTMESKAVPGLFFAGQINGTSGYEEAAAQGIIAGINAALKVQGRPPFVLHRDQAYIGVMLDDLTTKEITEPYRLLTSRAEFRLLLRQDNADLRLTPFGYELGLISRERYEMVTRKQEMVRWALEKLDTVRLAPSSAFDHALMKLGLPALERGTSGKEFMRRPEVTYKALDLALGQAVPRDVAEQVEIEAKYEGYIQKQRVDVERMRKLEERRIPPDTDYQSIAGLRIEAKQKLSSFRPVTIGQASRIGGVTPADVAVLLVHLQRLERRVAK
jgi:tRNA uridine 5-carboxymethylaminomethyl modification enzyme